MRITRINKQDNNQIRLFEKKIIVEPSTVVELDIIGPLPITKSRNQYVLVFAKMFAK